MGLVNLTKLHKKNACNDGYELARDTKCRTPVGFWRMLKRDYPHYAAWVVMRYGTDDEWRHVTNAYYGGGGWNILHAGFNDLKRKALKPFGDAWARRVYVQAR